MVSSSFTGRRRSFYNRPNSFVPDGNRNVRILVAKYHGRCELCPFPIIAYRSRVARHFDTGAWVHVSCIDRLPRSE